jgi:hypothetical protein
MRQGKRSRLKVIFEKKGLDLVGLGVDKPKIKIEQPLHAKPTFDLSIGYLNIGNLLASHAIFKFLNWKTWRSNCKSEYSC